MNRSPMITAYDYPAPRRRPAGPGWTPSSVGVAVLADNSTARLASKAASGAARKTRSPTRQPTLNTPNSRGNHIVLVPLPIWPRHPGRPARDRRDGGQAAGLNPFSLGWPRFLVAEDGGRVVGVAQIKPHGDGSRELASLAVVARPAG